MLGRTCPRREQLPVIECQKVWRFGISAHGTALFGATQTGPLKDIAQERTEALRR